MGGSKWELVGVGGSAWEWVGAQFSINHFIINFFFFHVTYTFSKNLYSAIA